MLAYRLLPAQTPRIQPIAAPSPRRASPRWQPAD